MRRGVEQLAARRAHNPKVAGSSPAPATKLELWCRGLTCQPVTLETAGSNPVSSANRGPIAQLARAHD